MTIEIAFDAKMQQRFLDRAFAEQLSPMLRRYYTRAGGAIRKTAKNSIRKAAQKPLSQLTESERIAYARAKERYAAGKSTIKPRRPDKTAKFGQIPLAHPKPKSLLKDRLFFALSTDGSSVVIGPELIGANKRRRRQGDLDTVQQLERGWPFMEPAFQNILPRLPAYLQQAKGS